MKDTHELPDDLNPEGDVCYPLLIPNDAQYRALVLGAIGQLTIPEYYREFDFALADVEAVCRLWTERTLVPLVQVMNDETPCTEDLTLPVTRLAATRTSDQTFTTGVEAPLDWQSGDFDATNINRIPITVDGIAIISVTFIATSTSNGVINVRLEKNGTTFIARDKDPVASQSHWIVFTTQTPVVIGDYINVAVQISGTSPTIPFSSGTQPPRIDIVILPLV